MKQLNLTEGEILQIGRKEIGISHIIPTDYAQLKVRFDSFVQLVLAITGEPQPERKLFDSEWQIKPFTKAAAKKGLGLHLLGGTFETKVACPGCGCATNQMARFDLSDPALPQTVFGSRSLPVFWCLDCGEWDPVHLDLSGPKPIALNDKGIPCSDDPDETSEPDLPEHGLQLVPVPPGKKAGRKSKLGGAPTWIQNEDSATCPKCQEAMSFVLQLDSDLCDISFGDMGMLYLFACPTCKVTSTLIQSH